MKRHTWIWDALLVLGSALVAGGLYWIYPPLALLGGGAALICLALWGAKKCS